MTEDFTDAKREDAADLLSIVDKNRKTTRQMLRPGLPELFVLLTAWSAGRLFSLDKETSFIKSLVAFGAAALLIDTAVWLKRRTSVGSEVASWTWLLAGAVFTFSIRVGLGQDGDRRQFVLALGLVVACALIAATHRSRLLAIVGVAMLALAGAQLWPLVIGAPMVMASMALGHSFQKKLMQGAK